MATLPAIHTVDRVRIHLSEGRVHGSYIHAYSRNRMVLHIVCSIPVYPVCEEEEWPIPDEAGWPIYDEVEGWSPPTFKEHSVQLSRLFASSTSITSLHITAQYFKIDRVDLVRFIGGFSCLVRLAVSCRDWWGRDEQDACIILTALCTRQRGGNYLCPCLETVILPWESRFHRRSDDKQPETDDDETWYSYGLRETEEMCRVISPLLQCRAASGFPLKEIALSSPYEASLWWLRECPLAASEVEDQLKMHLGWLVENVHFTYEWPEDTVP